MTRFAQVRFLAALMIGAYVILNTLMMALEPFTHGMTPLLSTAVVVPPMVLAMVYVVIPIAKRA